MRCHMLQVRRPLWHLRRENSDPFDNMGWSGERAGRHDDLRPVTVAPRNTRPADPAERFGDVPPRHLITDDLVSAAKPVKPFGVDEYVGCKRGSGNLAALIAAAQKHFVKRVNNFEGDRAAKAAALNLLLY